MRSHGLASQLVTMSVEQTQRTLDRYFDLMGKDEDFAECFSADVTWLIADTEEVVRGPSAVRSYILALHARMADSRGRKTVVGDDYVYLEGDCAASVPDNGSRINYCIAYTVKGDQITAMRCYGLGAVET